LHDFMQFKRPALYWQSAGLQLKNLGRLVSAAGRGK
jgi:hypothetical protein